MTDINDCHQFNLLLIPDQIKTLRMTILKRLKTEEPTLRDHFAMAALTGELAACAGSETSIDIKKLSVWCYEVSDAMLAAREGK